VEKLAQKVQAPLGIFKKLPKENKRPIGENSPNLVTLACMYWAKLKHTKAVKAVAKVWAKVVAKVWAKVKNFFFSRCKVGQHGKTGERPG
jgi:hypothetical protein